MLQNEFVLSISSGGSPVVISVPHEGLGLEDLNFFFRERTGGFHSREDKLSEIVARMSRPTMAASFVRGLLPRLLCDYNRPEEKDGKRVAYEDLRLKGSYDLYHHCIDKYLAEALGQHKRALLIDLHAFRAEGYVHPCSAVLGTWGGETSPRTLHTACAKSLEEAGFSTHHPRAGEKFSGGYTVRQHFKKFKGKVDTLQIEVSTAVTHGEAPTLCHDFAQALRKFVQLL